MLKRTKGRLLLALLVTTGLAGTINNSTLSQKERKQSILLFKNSRAELVAATRGLSPAQANFHPAPGEPSIAQLLVGLVDAEQLANTEIRQTMRQPSGPGKRTTLATTDQQLLAQQHIHTITVSSDVPKDLNVEEVMKKFLGQRADHIRYIRTSTEDFRNHVMTVRGAALDCYQYHLVVATRTSRVAREIQRIRALPGFPRK